ncbi:protein NDRG3-like isoform X1 [Ylistrum balloti]|uniref:protein NDRG3-like isoform X1 n=1 Tax=Ylistrum balloti TaxID=509963 RepID=UPI002905CCC3|nr:protein NDRG3-like isoform X1 [Ylistrum balloti]
METNPLLDDSHDKEERTMERITDIELSSIQSENPQARSFSNNATSILIQEDDIETPYGNLHVAIQGDRSKMAIITLHDIGLNHVTNFQGFFSYQDMQPILRHFCVYHVNAPGQEESALHLRPEHDALGNPDSLGKRFVYPSMDELAHAIQNVVDNYGLARFIGFGMGTGSNILARYALRHPETVDSLVLINPTSGKSGWVEWGYQKMNSWYLWSGQMTNFTEEYLLWHWFGSKTRWTNTDLVQVFREYIKTINPQNLSLIIESYLKRTDLGIVRELDQMKRSGTNTIKCRTMLLVGDDSPHIDDVIGMNSRMDPQETDFFKIADCGGMPLEEQPGKVCEAFRLFLQGMGYVPSLNRLPSQNHVANNNPKKLVNTTDFTNVTPVC